MTRLRPVPNLLTINVFHTDDDLRAARQDLVTAAGVPVWRLRHLHASFQLPQDQQAILRRIDELDYLSSDTVVDTIGELARTGTVTDDIAVTALNIRNDLNGIGAPPARAEATTNGAALILHWPNGATVLIGEHEYVLDSADGIVRGPVEHVEEVLADFTDAFTTDTRADNAGETATAGERREDAPKAKLARIWQLYRDECERTVNGCSDDLELFLADLREALDS